MSVYAKPLRGGGSRIIPRDAGGRFARECIEVDVYPHCQRFNPATQTNVGSERFPLLKMIRAEVCHACGKPIREAEEEA